MGKRMRAPNCTHVDMDRVFGREQQCYVCGRSPSIGFLYECRQDSDAESLQDLLLHDTDKIEPAKSELRKELETIGLSESIIVTAESGHYTRAQLNKLKELKLELRETIADMRQASQANEVMSQLTAIAKAPSNTDGAFNSRPMTTESVSALEQSGPPRKRRKLTADLMEHVTDSPQKPLGCAFRACHTCRPYYQDRLYISFQAVLNAEFPPMTRGDIEELPTKSAKIMRTIGQTKAQPLPSSMTLDTSPSTLLTTNSLATSTDAPHTALSNTTDSSELTFKTTQTDIDEISAQRRPRRRFYKMGRRSSGEIARVLTRGSPRLTAQGLKSAVQSIFRPGRESSSSGSNITLPLPRTGTARDVGGSASVGEFDLGALRRVRKQKERNDIRNGTYTGGYEDVTSATAEAGDGVGENSSEESEFSVYTFATDDGDAMEVDGVALTGEAVETHTPDIVAVNIVPAQKNGALITTKALDEEDETGADIRLQSIMAQV
jgi:hypothetical protein